MKKKNRLIIIFHNQQLIFSIQKGNDDISIIEKIPFSDALSTDVLSISIPPEAKKPKEIILILPDYVAGNSIYPFTTGKRSVAETFIRRKLSETFPALPDIPDFFNYTYISNSDGPGSLYAFYLKESIAFILYKQLSAAGLRPDRITTPAYIWQDKIGKNSGHKSGESLCIIHALAGETQLFFYVNGNFLFSRSIMLPGESGGNKEKLDSLAFEIRQSLYLFSQKTKSEVGKFYIMPSANIDETGLSEKIGKSILRIGTESEDEKNAVDKNPMPGPLAAFSSADICSATLPSISHRSVVLEKFWHTVQITGIVTGIITLLLICAETAYFKYWSYRNISAQTDSLSKNTADNIKSAAHYNKMLDIVIEERERPDPANILAGISLSLSDKVTVRELLFNLESPSQVIVKGIVTADEPDSIKRTLSEMVGGLTRNLDPARPPVIGDIGFDMEGDAGDQSSPEYKFHVKVDMK